jgi:hypothetical protein
MCNSASSALCQLFYPKSTYCLIMELSIQNEDILNSDHLRNLNLFMPLSTWALIHLFPSSVSLWIVVILTISNTVWWAGYIKNREQLRWRKGVAASRVPTMAWGDVARHVRA